MTKEEMLSVAIKCFERQGYIMTNDEEQLKLLDELVQDGIIYNVKAITGVDGFNHRFTYVSSDEKGIQIAKTIPV